MPDKDINQNTTQEDIYKVDHAEEMHLDDARRVKVLSPGMLVFKRFIRNKLAVVGFVILLFMFTFSFLGPFFSPFGQTEVFKGVGTMSKDYAGATYNEELRYTIADGAEFGSSQRTQFLLALGENNETFTCDDQTYYYVNIDDNTYRIMQLEPVAEVILKGFNSLTDDVVPDELITAYKTAEEKGVNSFELDGIFYRITKKNKASIISIEIDVALATLDVYDAYNESDKLMVSSFDFRLASSLALAQNSETFTVGNQTYSIRNGEGQVTILDSAGNEYAEISAIIVNPLDQSVFLTVGYKSTIRQMIINRQSRFSYTHENGETIEYTIARVNKTYNIKKETPIEMIRLFENPSAEHPLGLDNNGMDVMTRLMHGGRVSLLVGFIVIFIEVFIGIIVGGVSGYFGGWVSRRIFKHLIPNVMPILIVQATAGLGGIIITEATLGFLGLGVKYPLASWGSIINVASDAFIMTSYWFMWIPAGMLILLTVLGFNFVGDGLRDAYDPKMKR
ncbi:MAG: hypothetical protein B5M51_08240 [Anaerolinea sp. 4484_236]|nr:MAG: hypothetical protein B5M51_08240 [Anaerolinea sp. 4484_236]